MAADFKTTRPLSVTIAAGSLLLLAMWQASMKAVPAFRAGDPSALQEMLSVALSLFIVWGVFTLQRWAWWLAIITSAIVSAIALGVLGSFDELMRELEPADPAAFSRSLSILGGLSITAFLCLLMPSSRAAFRS